MVKHEDALFVRDAITDAVLAAFALLVRDQSNGVKLDVTLIQLRHEVINAVNQRIEWWKNWEELEQQGLSPRRLGEFISDKD